MVCLAQDEEHYTSNLFTPNFYKVQLATDKKYNKKNKLCQ